MTPQTTPLYLTIYFDDGTNGKYPIVGWVPSTREAEVWSPVVAVWDNRVALTIHSHTTSILFGDGTRVISTAYLAGAQ
jgi:hypothetical protein